MSSNTKLEEIVRLIVKRLLKEASLPLQKATRKPQVYPLNWKSSSNYIRITRKSSTEEWVVAWFSNGKFDDNKSYYTNDFSDAEDTFTHMQKYVDQANVVDQNKINTDHPPVRETTESVAGDNFTKFMRRIALDSAKFKLVSFKDIPVGSAFKAGAFAPYYDYVKTNDASAAGTDGKKKWISNFSPDNKVAVLSQPPVAEMSCTGAAAPVTGPNAFVKKKFNETVTGDVSGFNVPGAFSKKGGSAAGVAGSAALGYKLTPMGEKEMERRADKLTESSQAALGKKFSKSQRSYDAKSEPESKRERSCSEDGHDWTIKGSGKTAYRKCDCCGKTVHPGEKED